MEKIKAAVIGCGRMGAFTSANVRKFAPSCWLPLSHSEAINVHDGLILQAMSDTDKEALYKASSLYKVKNIYNNPLDLIDKEDIELLCIATRTIGRADIISFAIESGVCAIHLEKPLCNSVKELLHLKSLIDTNEVFMTYGAVRRFFPIYKYACNLANSNKYGDLKEIRFNAGLAPLYWTHPHSIDLILYAAGKRKVSGVQAIFSNMQTSDKKTEILSDPTVKSATIYFDDGVTGVIDQSIGLDFVLICEYAEIIVRSDGKCIDIYASDGDNPYPVILDSKVTFNEINGGTFLPVSELVSCLKGDVVARSDNNFNKESIFNGQDISFSMIQSHITGGSVVENYDYDPEIFIHAITKGNPA